MLENIESMLNRRRLITSVVTAGAVAISGCSGDEGDPTGSTGGKESTEETDNEDTEAQLRNRVEEFVSRIGEGEVDGVNEMIAESGQIDQWTADDANFFAGYDLGLNGFEIVEEGDGEATVKFVIRLEEDGEFSGAVDVKYELRRQDGDWMFWKSIEDEEPDDESADGGSDDEAASEEAEFELVEWTMPSEVELNEEIEIGMVIKNAGGQADDYTAPLYERTPDSDWTRVSEVDFGTIQPDEEVEMVFEDIVYSYINRYELRLGDFQQTSAIQVLSAKIDWGTKYTTPNGYIIRVDEPELQKSYEYKDYTGATKPKEPDSGGKWAFLNVYVKNETGKAEFSPLVGDISLLYGNSQADGETILLDEPINKGEPFEGGELQPGVERSGWIAYQIAGDVSTDDLNAAWSKTTISGEISVNWE